MQTKLTAEQEAAVVLEGKDAFTAIAKEQGLEYGETDLVSIPKFRDIRASAPHAKPVPPT